MNPVLPLKQGIMDKLMSDELLAQMLGQYDQRAAVFGTSPVPETAGEPFVVVTAPNAVRQLESKSPDMWEVLWDVRLFQANDGDVFVADNPSDYIASLFNRQRIDVPGWNVYMVEATGPIDIGNAELYGRAVELRIQLTRR